jgi:hypothetical protein
MINFSKKILLIILLIGAFIVPIFTVHNLTLPIIGQNMILIQDLYIDYDSAALRGMSDETLNEEMTDFKNENVNPTIIFLALFWFVLSIFWSLLSDSRKVFRPGSSSKFILLWIIIFFIANGLSMLGCWYFMSQVNVGIGMMGPNELMLLYILSFSATSLYYYLSSLLTTSRAMRPSVPFANRFLR